MSDRVARIARVRRATDTEWDDAWRASPHASYFESRDWAEAWSLSAARFRPDGQAIEFSDGTTVILPSTLESRAGGIARLRRMSPGDTYGSWLHPGGLDPSYADAILGRVIGGKESTRWLINPFLGATVHPRDAGHATHTSAMDLSRTFEVLRSSWSKGHRSAVGQARRSGVTISVASTIEEWRDYYAAYEASLQRWGTSATSRYPWTFFEQLQRYRDGAKLWLAKIEGRVVAGALCLYSPSIVAYWHGAAYEAAFAKRPVNLLLHDAIQDASARGARWFDLGPSGGHEGVERFKRGFAPERLVVHVVDRATPAIAAARWVRSHIKGVGRCGPSRA